MAVKIRLRRLGSNKKPYFRIVAADVRASNQGRILDTLGWYDPKKKTDNFKINLEKVDYWLSKGALISDTARSLVRKQRRKAAPKAAPAS